MKGGSRSMKERTYIAIDLKSFYASVECRERGLDPRWTRTLLSQTKAVPTRPSASQLHPLSSPTAFQAVAVCLRLSSELKRPTPDGSMTLRDTSWKVPPASILNFLKTQTSRLTSLSPRHAWPITWNTAPGFTMSIWSMLHRRTSSYIPSTKCSWMSLWRSFQDRLCG